MGVVQVDKVDQIIAKNRAGQFWFGAFELSKGDDHEAGDGHRNHPLQNVVNRSCPFIRKILRGNFLHDDFAGIT